MYKHPSILSTESKTKIPNSLHNYRGLYFRTGLGALCKALGSRNCMHLGIESSTFAILIAADVKELIRMVLHHTEHISKETYSKAKY